MWMLRYHARIQEFLLGWGVQAGLPENSSDNVILFFFSSHLVYSFTEDVLWLFQKKFSKDSEGVQHFPGGGGGPNLSREWGWVQIC